MKAFNLLAAVNDSPEDKNRTGYLFLLHPLHCTEGQRLASKRVFKSEKLDYSGVTAFKNHSPIM